MRNKYLFNKYILGLFMVGSLSLTTACSFRLRPITEVPSNVDAVINALSETIDCYPDDYLNNQISAEIIIDDLADESENYGYELEKCTLVRVVDGDTIVVDYNGSEVKVRLIGINTPESVASEEYLQYKNTQNTQEGKNASEWLKDFLKDYEYIYLQKDISETDKYGRLLRYVWLEVPTDKENIEEIRIKMLNGILLSEGIAETTIYEPDTKYAEEFYEIEFDDEEDIE